MRPYSFFIIRQTDILICETCRKNLVAVSKETMTQRRANEVIITCARAISAWEYPRTLPKFAMLFYFSSYAFMVRCTIRFADFLALLHKADKIPKMLQSGKSVNRFLHLLKLDISSKVDFWCIWRKYPHYFH